MSTFSLETCPSSAAFFGFMGVASSMVFGSEFPIPQMLRESSPLQVACGVAQDRRVDQSTVNRHSPSVVHDPVFTAYVFVC